MASAKQVEELLAATHFPLRIPTFHNNGVSSVLKTAHC